jgi:uncharacterized protein
MAEARPAQGGADPAALEALLDPGDTPEAWKQLAGLDGFLTAIAICPELIPPGEWLPLVWGEDGPEPAGLDEAERALGLILLRYNEILRLLRAEPDAYMPILGPGADGAPIAADWAEGFMDGIQLRGGAWSPLFDDDETAALLAPIAVQLEAAEEEGLIDLGGSSLADVRRRAVPLIAPAVVAIDAHWRALRRQPARASKVGRNDPCPCGSGRKYKRCCANR